MTLTYSKCDMTPRKKILKKFIFLLSPSGRSGYLNTILDIRRPHSPLCIQSSTGSCPSGWTIASSRFSLGLLDGKRKRGQEVTQGASGDRLAVDQSVGESIQRPSEDRVQCFSVSIGRLHSHSQEAPLAPLLPRLKLILCVLITLHFINV